MNLVLSLSVIFCIYLWAYFTDKFFKSCSHYGYIQFLKGIGLEVKFLQFKWTTDAFNFPILRFGTSRPRFFNLWFNVGLYASLILYPISIYILLLAIVQDFKKEEVDNVIQPALPGVTLPGSELGYYSLTLLISSVLHELGHALAAVQYDVTIANVGANILFIVPIAFVSLNSEKLFSLNPWKRLQILSAGVWHNILVAAIAYLVYIALPSIFSPLYTFNKGVIANDIAPKSPFLGNRGLNVGDIIFSINDCVTPQEDAWYKCMHSLQVNKPAFCIGADLVHTLDESMHVKYLEDGRITCCRSNNDGKMCFEYLDTQDNILEFPSYVCLPGRAVIEYSANYCSYSPHLCPKDTFCFRPMVANNSNLYKIKRHKNNDVIYIGPVSDFVTTLTVSSYIPKYNLLSSALPEVILKFSEYMVVFSTGLAVINILPIFFLDGQLITNTLFYIAFSNHLRTTHIKLMSGIVCLVFTFMLFVHFIVGILPYLK